jgi:phosphoserine phosphatase RsbU/P
MKSLLKRHRRKAHLALNAVGAGFPILRDAEMAAVSAGRGIAGDFCDSIRVNPERVLFGLADTGVRHKKSLEVAAITQHAFRELGSQLLGSSEVNESDALSELCLQLNRVIIEAASTAHACPAFVGCYNEGLGTVCYCNAGHVPGLVRHTGDISELGPTGLALGLFSHTTCDARMIALEPGAALLLVSQGVVDAKQRHEEFGLARVEEVLKASSGASAHEVCVSALDAVQHFAGRRLIRAGTATLALVRHTMA